MSIQIENLRKNYGRQEVLKGISLSIDSGEVVGFIGPNGAGKSTTMKCVTGYVPFDEGKIEVCGIDVTRHPLEAKRRIGYLPEHNPLYLEMYVKEYLEYVARLYKLDKPMAKVNAMVECVGLSKESGKRISQLSKGYRQRVGLAQAMIHDPEVLILDEPTTGLDPNQIVEIRELISEMGKKKTVVLSTHIMQEVSAICDRVVVINHGEIVANEREREIVTEQEEEVFVVEVKGGKMEQEKARKVLEANGLVVNDVRAKEKNLEEVFHQLTSK